MPATPHLKVPGDCGLLQAAHDVEWCIAELVPDHVWSSAQFTRQATYGDGPAVTGWQPRSNDTRKKVFAMTMYAPPAALTPSKLSLTHPAALQVTSTRQMA